MPIKVLINSRPLRRQGSFVFPGGEVQVNLAANPLSSLSKSHCEIVARIQGSDDIMELLLTVDAVRREYNPKFMKLTLPYVPYARQDRVCNRGEALSAKVFCDLVNSLNFNEVVICDPHSEVTPALLSNCVVIGQEFCIDKAELKTQYDSVVSPDAGASKKVYKVAYNLDISKVIEAGKVRNTMTGEITGTRYSGDVIGKRCLIVDDICDGGRTFTELAKVLKEGGAAKVDLYVTHGIFSKGLDPILDHIDHIYTTNTYRDNYLGHKNLTVFNIV